MALFARGNTVACDFIYYSFVDPQAQSELETTLEEAIFQNGMRCTCGALLLKINVMTRDVRHEYFDVSIQCRCLKLFERWKVKRACRCCAQV